MHKAPLSLGDVEDDAAVGVAAVDLHAAQAHPEQPRDPLARRYVCAHVCMCVCMHACTFIYIHVYIYIYICIYVCIYIYIYIYPEVHRFLF